MAGPWLGGGATAGGRENGLWRTHSMPNLRCGGHLDDGFGLDWDGVDASDRVGLFGSPDLLTPVPCSPTPSPSPGLSVMMTKS